MRPTAFSLKFDPPGDPPNPYLPTQWPGHFYDLGLFALGLNSHACISVYNTCLHVFPTIYDWKNVLPVLRIRDEGSRLPNVTTLPPKTVICTKLYVLRPFPLNLSPLTRYAVVCPLTHCDRVATLALRACLFTYALRACMSTLARKKWKNVFEIYPFSSQSVSPHDVT